MTWQQFGSWFILTIVLIIYAVSFYRRIYPVGHPWAGVCLLLLAYDSLLAAYNLEVGSVFLRLALHWLTSIAAGLWLYSALRTLLKKDEL